MITRKQQELVSGDARSRSATSRSSAQRDSAAENEDEEVDLIETPGQQRSRQQQQNTNGNHNKTAANELIEGSDPVTTLGCVGAQTGSSRLVVCMLKEGKQFQLKVQEMRPAMLEIGANSRENEFMVREQESFVQNLRRQERGPLDAWMEKFKDKWSHEERMYFPIDSSSNLSHNYNSHSQTNGKTKRRLTYMCMGENVATCWRALLNQLDRRSELLAAGSRFYSVADELIRNLEFSEQHVQKSRYVLLGEASSEQDFKRVLDQIKINNETILANYKLARKYQADLIAIIEQIGRDKCGDSRPSLQISDDARALIAYIRGYLEVLERRKLQLETTLTSLYQEVNSIVVNKSQMATRTTVTVTTTHDNNQHQQQKNQDKENVRMVTPQGQSNRNLKINKSTSSPSSSTMANRKTTTTTLATNNNSTKRLITNDAATTMLEQADNSAKPLTIRELNSLKDLISIEQWLETKLGQLNSSLLSSLGSNVTDSRCILTKHGQIMLECRCIDEAASKFKGRSIHGIRASEIDEKDENFKLLERQRALLTRVREVISILEVRVVLLRRTIDFYLRSRDATGDIIKMMRRLQVDNSLQSVHFVSNELELRDVSSVVASGATILSELQQLQLAQQQGHRASCVHLSLETSGIRALIDELNHDLAHLKSVLNQRRLVLQNEDSEKMASSFISKCEQLHLWLEQQLNTFLLANARLGSDLNQVAQFCLEHERMRASLQQKASEVDALLRSMASLGNQDSKLLTATNNTQQQANPSSNEVKRNQSVQEAADELRRDWIEASNCLGRRIDLAKRYAAIMQLASLISNELDALDRFSGRPLSSTAASSASSLDPRGEEELRVSVQQRLVQLGAEVKLVTEVARPESIQINSINIMQQQANNGRPQSQLNHEQVSDHANAILSRLLRARREVEQRIENSRKKATQQPPQTRSSPIEKQQQVISNQEPIKSQKPVSIAPKFVRPLEDKALEPFARVELECELDQPGCRVEWSLNSHKRIPASIRHSTESANEGRLQKLVINNFSPISCGTYTAKAISESSGLVSSSHCKLTLVGIKEHSRPQRGRESSQASSSSPRNDLVMATQPNPQVNQQVSITTTTTTNQISTSQQPSGASPSAISTRSSFSQWRPATNKNNNNLRPPIERIIRGVNEIEREQKASPIDSDTQSITQSRYNHQQQQVFSSHSDQAASNLNTIDNQSSPTVIINRQHYRGPTMVELNHIDSPSMGSTTSSLASRSISKSPSVQPKQRQQQLVKAPEFIQELRADSSLSPRSSQSRAELVCVVVGNPPPIIEWLHNDQLIASARCTRTGSSAAQQAHNNICKLSIETRNPDTSGQYVCRARNRYGQSSSGYLITNQQ